FATNGARVEHRTELIPLLNEALRGEPSAVWLERLEAAGIPSGPILDVAEAFGTPQARARDSRIPVRHPKLGPVDQVASPIRLGGADAPPEVPEAPPVLGEHARAILTEAGDS